MKLKINFDIKNLFEYILIIVATSAFLTLLIIALPLTENLTDRVSYDLITKDDYYWSKEYNILVNSEDTNDVEVVRDTIYKRLQGFGVERVKIYEVDTDAEGIFLKIFVESSLDETFVRELISNRFDVSIVTKKEDVDFFNEEDPYSYLFAENYEGTDWDREDFRNIHVTKLKTADNNYSFFAIFKLWPHKQADFNKFLNERRGEYIGVNIDGFVTPYLVPIEDQGVFAVPLNTEDENQATAISLLYNSGIINTDITLENEVEREPTSISMNHISISVALAISILLTYVILLLTKQSEIEDVKKAFLATLLSITIYIAVLKLFQIPVDVFIIALTTIMTSLLIKMLVLNKDSLVYIEGGIMITFLLVRVLGMGYVQILASHILGLVILSKICVVLIGWYINKIREI